MNYSGQTIEENLDTLKGDVTVIQNFIDNLQRKLNGVKEDIRKAEAKKAEDKKIKPCPFCGCRHSTAVVREEGSFELCNSCGARGPSLAFNSGFTWNDRA